MMADLTSVPSAAAHNPNAAATAELELELLPSDLQFG